VELGEARFEIQPSANLGRRVLGAEVQSQFQATRANESQHQVQRGLDPTTFDLSPAVLGRTESFGDPKCDPDYATQSFFFDPPAPEGFLASFRPTSDGSAWVLISVNCKAIMDGMARQIC